MLYHDNDGRLLLAQEHATRLARDFGPRRDFAGRRLGLDLARFLSRRRQRRLYRSRAYSA